MCLRLTLPDTPTGENAAEFYLLAIDKPHVSKGASVLCAPALSCSFDSDLGEMDFAENTISTVGNI